MKLLLSLFIMHLGLALYATGPSLERLTRVVEKLASGEMEGRGLHQSGREAARLFLQEYLKANNFEPAGEEGYLQNIELGANLLAILYPDGSKGNPTVLVGAHFDHLGEGCKQSANAQTGICNGAADNAAGVAAAVEAVISLAGQLKTPVALALWDREETGLQGSDFFAANPSFPTQNLKLIINLDIIGLNLFKGLERHHFALGAETGGPELQKDLDLAAAGLPLKLTRLSYAFGHNRSDHSSFVLANYQIPLVFLTDGDGSVYHSNADELGRLNFEKVFQVATLTANLTRQVANGLDAYTYQKPVIMGNNAIPGFSDVAGLKALFIALQAQMDQASMEEKQSVEQVISSLQAMETAGPEAFGVPQMQALGEMVRGLIQISRTHAN